MKHPRLNARAFAILSFAAAATFSSQAWSQDCSTDADCADGLVCELVGESACAEAPPCLPGENCTDEEPPPCEPEEIYACVPDLVECDSDADCASGLTCISFTYDDCGDVAIGTDEPGSGGEDSGGGSDPGAPDPDAPGDTPDDIECETVTEAFCAPAWVGGCETDSDCGDGFTCVEIEECSCGGSSGSGSAGGGEVPPEPGTPTPDPDDAPDAGSSDGGGSSDEDGSSDDLPEDDGPGDDIDCTCAGIGEFYCEPVEVSCTDDADCPDSWSCETFSSEVTCTFDAETGEEFCDEGESESFCAPPFWDAWGGAYGAEDGVGGVDLGAMEPERASGESTDDSDNSGSAGGLDTETPRTSADEGCTAAGGGAGGAWLLGLLGLLGIRRRR